MLFENNDFGLISFMNIPGNDFDSKILPVEDGFIKGNMFANEYKPYIYVKGYTEDSFKNIGVILLEGDLPKNENEILVTSHLKYNGGVELKIGDTITLNIGRRLIDGSEGNQNNPFQPDFETIMAEERQRKIERIREEATYIYDLSNYEETYEEYVDTLDEIASDEATSSHDIKILSFRKQIN